MASDVVVVDMGDEERVGIAYAQGREPILHPCPFCGTTKINVSKFIGHYRVECGGSPCPASPMVSGKTEAEAIDKWNTRPNDEMAAEAYTLRWLREEAKEGGWDLLDLVEAARAKKIARITRRDPPGRYNEDGF